MELERQAVVIPDAVIEAELSQQRRDLLTKANQVLGYKRGITTVTRREAEATDLLKSTQQVKNTLEAAGIVPMSIAAVKQYKHRQKRKAYWRHGLRNCANSAFGLVCMPIGAVMSVVSFVVSLALCISYFDGDLVIKTSFLSGARLVPFFALPTGLVLWLGLALIRKRTNRTRFSFDWMSISLPNYERDLPDFALVHGIAIKQQLPDADLRIEQLVAEQRRTPVFDPDPFLVLRHGGVDYYIDVWDERDFERKN